MTKYFDDLETRDPGLRERKLFEALQDQIANAKKHAPYFTQLLKDVHAHEVVDRAGAGKAAGHAQIRPDGTAESAIRPSAA